MSAREEALAMPDSLMAVHEGRSLSFSPDWDGDGVSILFDGNSGDYWVLSPLTRALVSWVMRAGKLSREELLARARTDARADSSPGKADEDADTVLGELVQLAILSHTANPS